MSLPGDERDGDDPPEEGVDSGGDAPDPATDDVPGPDSVAGSAGPTGRGRPEGRPRQGGIPAAREEWSETGEREGPPRRHTEDTEAAEWRLFVHDVASSVLAVVVVGAYLYAVSGVWPPLVAVESRSMSPNMQVNDLVFVMEAGRFPGPDAQGDAGVVTARAGQGVDYRTFGGYGDVIVYERNGDDRSVPIIHRAMLWVEEGENWYARADQDYVTARECGETPGEGLRNCPAPHAGFITKGDNNARYDQVSGLSGPVRPGWVVGTAELRVPGLGWVRLQSQAASADRSLGHTGANGTAARAVVPAAPGSRPGPVAATGGS